jgi:hypothetical protein
LTPIDASPADFGFFLLPFSRILKESRTDWWSLTDKNNVLSHHGTSVWIPFVSYCLKEMAAPFSSIIIIILCLPQCTRTLLITYGTVSTICSLAERYESEGIAKLKK